MIFLACCHFRQPGHQDPGRDGSKTPPEVTYPGRVHSAHAQGVFEVAPSRVENVIWQSMALYTEREYSILFLSMEIMLCLS